MHIVLDTNVFLEHQPITQIPWRSVAASEWVELVVPVDVVRELDSLKHSERLRDRARAGLRLLRAIKSGEEKCDASWFGVDDAPPDCGRYGLDPSVTDHRVLGVALRHAANGHPVKLCTADFGLQIEASTRKIDVLELPERYARNRQDPQQAKQAKWTTSDPYLYLLGWKRNDIRLADGLRIDEPDLHHRLVLANPSDHVLRDTFVSVTRQQGAMRITEGFGDPDARLGDSCANYDYDYMGYPVLPNELPTCYETSSRDAGLPIFHLRVPKLLPRQAIALLTLDGPGDLHYRVIIGVPFLEFYGTVFANIPDA